MLVTDHSPRTKAGPAEWLFWSRGNSAGRASIWLATLLTERQPRFLSGGMEWSLKPEAPVWRRYCENNGIAFNGRAR
jgi:hypothetical protein